MLNGICTLCKHGEKREQKRNLHGYIYQKLIRETFYVSVKKRHQNYETKVASRFEKRQI